MKVLNANLCVFLREMSPFTRRMGSCALLGNRDRLHISRMQFFVNIVPFVLSLYET